MIILDFLSNNKSNLKIDQTDYSIMSNVTEYKIPAVLLYWARKDIWSLWVWCNDFLVFTLLKQKALHKKTVSALTVYLNARVCISLYVCAFSEQCLTDQQSQILWAVANRSFCSHKPHCEQSVCVSACTFVTTTRPWGSCCPAALITM